MTPVTLPNLNLIPTKITENSLSKRCSSSNRRGSHNSSLNHTNAQRRIHDTRFSRRQSHDINTSHSENVVLIPENGRLINITEHVDMPNANNQK